MANFNSLPPDFGDLYHKANPNDNDLNLFVDDRSNYCPSFELSGYISYLEALLLNDSSNSSFTTSILQTQLTQEVTSSGSSASASSIGGVQTNSNNTSKRGIYKTTKAEGLVFALKTRTNLENLDDGFKWRKYGKKMVKSNPNPRHYYKCTSEGCPVKKVVERDGEDSSCLLITYKGRHNHETPCITYHEKPPFDLPPSASMQPSKLLIRSSSV